MSADPDREALAAATARLEEIVRRIGEGDAGADELRALADEALEASGEITERLARVLRAAEGSG